MSPSVRPDALRIWIPLAGLVLALLTLTSPGRVLFCDDEVMFQTAQSIWEDGDLEISGLPVRTGERPWMPAGSFGVDGPSGYDPRGPKYGFFGIGTPIAAQPALGLAELTEAWVDPRFRDVIRRDLIVYHRPPADRLVREDWQRLWATWTNAWLTMIAALALAAWLRELGISTRTRAIVALAWPLGTLQWWYAGSFLSEPLSALALLVAAAGAARFSRDASTRAAITVGAACGVAIHAHLLNLSAVPVLFAYALGPTLVGKGADAPVQPRAPRHGDHALNGRDHALRSAASGAMAFLPFLLALGLLQWWQFGSPFETGRRGNYAHFIASIEPWVGMWISPGRGLVWLAPAMTVGVLAWALGRLPGPSLADGAGSSAREDAPRGWRDRARAVLGDPHTWALCMVVAVFVVRWAPMSLRSDWHGGWTLGPRYLVPAVPLAMLPLAWALERAREHRVGARAALTAAIAGSIGVSGWIALHSNYERMWRLMVQLGNQAYPPVANWRWNASPWAFAWHVDAPAWAALRAGRTGEALGLTRLDPLSVGAMRLSAVGVHAPLRLFAAIAVLAAICAAALALGLRRRPA